MFMQINRLFEIVYILLDKKKVTAKALADQFEVSIRTIYRDIEILSEAGIPIYTNKGRGGGINLLDNFILNKSLISENEQNEILASLQSLSAIKYPDAEPILNKLGTLFNKSIYNWIDVDFSSWSGGTYERESFDILKSAILEGKVISFYYFNSQGEKTHRMVEPLKLIFKGQAWYFYGYCRLKSDYRVFKISRVKELNITNETFQRSIPEDIFTANNSVYKEKEIKLILHIDKKMAYRVYDEVSEENITVTENGDFIVEINIADEKDVYGYILSYGAYIEVIEPKRIRKDIAKTLKAAIKRYK
jgi:predicted DNA-binding transcriptional regulator YafY